MSKFVPNHLKLELSDLIKLKDLLSQCKRVTVLTGAGISTESGVPDYRSEKVGLYATSSRKPIQHQDFMRNGSTRQSYWARNYMAWSRWSQIKPNETHLLLAKWERLQYGNDVNLPYLQKIITQNVDQLHFKAGSTRILELHGTNSLVKCTNERQCSYTIHRHQFQHVMKSKNSNMIDSENSNIRPDGDVHLHPNITKSFSVPSCPRCEGILKPYVVFFGDNVREEVLKSALNAVHDSDGLLVIGSSLQVYSGYRFILQAKEKGKSVMIVNIGQTRADDLADVKVDALASDVLKKLISGS